MNEKTLAILLYISVGININTLVDKFESDSGYTPPVVDLIFILFWPLVFVAFFGKWLGGGYSNG